jgi:hypothetical protein
MVPVVVAGDATFYRITQERTAMEKCIFRILLAGTIFLGTVKLSPAHGKSFPVAGGAVTGTWTFYPVSETTISTSDS